MVLVHFVENLSGQYGGDDGTLPGVSRSWWLPMGLAAPVFTFLSGVSYRLLCAAHRRRGWTDTALSKSTVRRGFFLIGLGFLFNVVVWLPEDVFNWDILTFIGGGILVMEVARRMPDGVVFLAAALVIAVAPAMRDATGYAEYWVAGSYDYDFTLADVAIGWLVTGYFPIFPWLAYPLIGFAAAPSLLSGSWRRLPIGIVLLAASAMVTLGWSALPAVVTGGAVTAWTMFPASTAYVLGTLGATWLAVTVMHQLLDDGDSPRGHWLVSWATPLSRHSLSMYLLHHVAHIWPLWAYGLATTGDARSLWQKAIAPAASVALAAVFVVAAAEICRAADRWHIPTAESFMRWLCD